MHHRLPALLLLCLLGIQGCISGTVKAVARHNNYSEYRLEMERINLEREKAKLPARPIMTYDEWRQANE